MNTEHKSNTPTEIRDLWQTPKALFDYYDKRFGFTLDLAASEDNKLCSQFIGEDENALSRDVVDEKYTTSTMLITTTKAWLSGAIHLTATSCHGLASALIFRMIIAYQ